VTIALSEQILGYLEQAGMAIALAAVVLIVVGFALASGRYVIRWRNVTLDRNFIQFKIDLGHTLTLGLEILVLADVIETITVTPTYQSLAVLAFLVVVRTIVSWTLILETEGHWPWQAPAEDQMHA
jgi:uncharacterized membrane protein